MIHKSPVSGTNRLGCKEPKKHNANSQIIAQRMKDEGIEPVYRYLLNGIFMIKVNLGNWFIDQRQKYSVATQRFLCNIFVVN